MPLGPSAPRPSALSLKPSAPRRSRAFTLVELLVVVGIIILVLAIAVPAVGPMLASNEHAAMVNSLNGLLVQAQAAAQANGTRVAVRFERAYALNSNGVMVDAQGLTPDDNGFSRPRYLDHQQARLVIFMARNERYYRQLPGTDPVALPKGAWIAPSYILEISDLSESNLTYQYDTGTPWRTLNRMDTFYVAFGPDGELTSSDADDNSYVDASQSRFSDGLVGVHSYLGGGSNPGDASARSLLVYNRNEFNSLNAGDGQARWNYLAREARPLYINRTLGSLIEERP